MSRTSHSSNNAVSLSPRKISGLLEVLKLALPHKRTLILGLIALTVASGINLGIPEIVRQILNSKSLPTLMENPILLCVLLSLVFLAQAVAFYYRSYWFSIVGHSVVFELREKLYNSLLKKPLEYFDRNRTGDLISRLNSDTLMIQDVVSIRLSVCIRYAFQVIIGITLMSILSWHLTLLIVVLIPLLVITARYFGKKLRALTKAQQEELGRASTSAEEAISGIRTVKAFSGEQIERERFESGIEEVKELGFSRSRFAAAFTSGVNCLMNLSLVVVLVVGYSEVTQGLLTTGDLTAFLLYGVIVAISFAFLSGSIGELYQAAGAADRIFEILHQEDEADTEATLSDDPITSVSFSKVSFSYPTRPDEKAVADLSFTLTQGRLTALVGPSGAGKSTVVNLLLRFYDPETGTITFNDSNVIDVSRDSIRSRIGLVPQDPVLFADSIAANLRYAHPQATDEELREAASKAAILPFIESLPEGFDTFVGERGVQISSGQRQRLAIARAVLKKPEILLFDEATSSLDSESEALVQEALNSLRKDCAVLAIAHRLSTIQNADQILVLHHGKIVQSGTHNTLIEEDGLYKRFVTYQELMAA